MGTSSLIRASTKSLNLSSLASLVETCRDLHNLGFNVIVVSSGAVAVGCQRLGLSTRPRELAKKQALAAIGQIHLMRYYDDLFTALGLVSVCLPVHHASLQFPTSSVPSPSFPHPNHLPPNK